MQAVKDPMKTKGARLTTEISLPGRFLVYVPNGEGLGVSRRLEDAERARLKDIIKGLEVKEGGVIVRTAAEGASAEDVERDLVFLQRLWKTIPPHRFQEEDTAFGQWKGTGIWMIRYAIDNEIHHRGQGYVYPHDDPAGFEVDNLPEELRGRRYYRPSGNGEEAE